MANWTVVEGLLADGRPMRAFLAAEGDSRLCAASLFDDVHTKSLQELEFRLGPGGHHEQKAGTAECPALSVASTQVMEYFRGQRQTFDVTIDLRGTPFQRRVWAALTNIPFGCVMSYGEVAETIGAFGASRAVGGANRRNFLPLFVPCHRVVAAGGKLGGYTGGLGLKRRLLLHESAVSGIPISAAFEW